MILDRQQGIVMKKLSYSPGLHLFQVDKLKYYSWRSLGRAAECFVMGARNAGRRAGVRFSVNSGITYLTKSEEYTKTKGGCRNGHNATCNHHERSRQLSLPGMHTGV